jgi:hypothetical protein
VTSATPRTRPIGAPFAESPIADQTGQYCANGQSGDVWFLAGSYSSDPLTRSCAVPSGKYLMMPAVNYLDDYPCPDPSFGPASGQSLEDFLIADAAAAIDGVDAAALEVDRTTFDAMDHRAHSPMFDFAADIGYQAVDGCITGTTQQFLTDGSSMIVEPLPAGAHTLRATAANPASGFSQDLTWNVTVE